MRFLAVVLALLLAPLPLQGQAQICVRLGASELCSDLAIVVSDTVRLTDTVSVVDSAALESLQATVTRGADVVFSDTASFEFAGPLNRSHFTHFSNDSLPTIRDTAIVVVDSISGDSVTVEPPSIPIYVRAEALGVPYDRVEFEVNGDSVNVERFAPYDMAPIPFDVLGLGAGEHTISARYWLPNGDNVTRTARVLVTICNDDLTRCLWPNAVTPEGPWRP